MTIQEICRNVEDLLRNDKGRTNFSPAARYAVRMLLDYAEREGAGMLLVSHTPALTERVATRKVKLSRGAS